MGKTHPREPTIFERLLFDVNTDLLKHPSAERALIKGTLSAKRSALRTATVLSWLSWPILIAVLLVSFSHLAEQVARVVPNGTSALRLSDDLYNVVALANTGLIDTIALYLVAVSTIAYFSGSQAGRLQWFYLTMTLALNAGYVLRHYPSVNTLVDDYILVVDVIIAVLLILMVPVSIFGVEYAQRVVVQIRLALLAEVTTYQDILEEQGEEPEKEPQLRESIRSINDRVIKLENDLGKLKTTPNGSEPTISCSPNDHGAEREGAAPRSQSMTEKDDPDRVERPLVEGRKKIIVHTCDVCHKNGLSATDKGISGRAKWRKIFGEGVYACKECREKSAQQSAGG